jgi:hypothetical protein
MHTRVCVATECDERQVDSRADESIVFDLNGPDHHRQDETVAVTLTVTGAAGTREASGVVELEVMSPGGPACGPSCVSGQPTPVGDSLTTVRP